jgi:rhodanese-related sulfurtransferase
LKTQELLKRIKSKQAPVILDVRSGFEFRRGHIPGALRAPSWKILTRLASIPSDKNAEMVVTCEHGPRARLAAFLLRAFGYRNITLLEGYMVAWKQTAGPLEK